MISSIPVTWNLDEIARLEFKQDHHKDLELMQDYARSGHESSKMIIYNYWEPSPMPDSILTIKKFFSEMDHVTLAVHKTPAGCYLPLHHDLYGRYRETFGVDDSRSIVRAIVMLAKSVPGQILQIDQELHGNWQAGQVFCWQDQTPHAIYNFSMQDRFAVQLTGVLV